jgi:hypothetical protein
MVKHDLIIYIIYFAVIIPSYMFRLLLRAIFRLVPKDIEYNCVVSSYEYLVIRDPVTWHYAILFGVSWYKPEDGS